MACRKAADRALMELSLWKEKQEAETDAKFRLFVVEQKELWTPNELFDQCCVKWLVDGGEVFTFHDHVRSGCSGACGKAHPRVTLDWKNGQPVATLSHELGPFVRYFDKLCEEGLAITPEARAGNLSYKLVGFLQPHIEKLEKSGCFGSHLLKVSTIALAASQRAHERQIEQEEKYRKVKRRKLQGPAAQNDLLESVLSVCYDHSLQDHLDLAEISWMRLSCKTMAKFAAKMALSRMRQLRLSCSVLLDGMVQLRDDIATTTASTNRSRSGQRVCLIDEGCILLPHHGAEPYNQILGENCRKVESYTVSAARIPLHISSSNKDEYFGKCDKFVSSEPIDCWWESVPLNKESSPFLELIESENFDCNYCGHMIRVFLGGFTADADIETKHTGCDNTFLQQLEVARCRINPQGLKEGIHTNSGITYDVISSFEEKSNPSVVVSDSSDPEALFNGCVRYKGKLSLQSITFDFGDLLGIYVRKKLPQEKKKMQEIKKHRPVTLSEKEYVKALAKAVRDAPGSAAAFDGMQGW